MLACTSTLQVLARHPSIRLSIHLSIRLSIHPSDDLEKPDDLQKLYLKNLALFITIKLYLYKLYN